MATEAALRAAKAIMAEWEDLNASYEYARESELAEVIDQATGLPTLTGSKAILKNCPHINTDTSVMAAGDSYTYLGRLNPEGKHDCEVCRKLMAFDGLVNACKAALYDSEDIEWTCGQGVRDETENMLRNALAKLEGTGS